MFQLSFDKFKRTKSTKRHRLRYIKGQPQQGAIRRRALQPGNTQMQCLRSAGGSQIVFEQPTLAQTARGDHFLKGDDAAIETDLDLAGGNGTPEQTAELDGNLHPVAAISDGRRQV